MAFDEKLDTIMTSSEGGRKVNNKKKKLAW
jgi:hypothetical protein